MIQRLLIVLGLVAGLSLAAWWLQAALFSAQPPAASQAVTAEIPSAIPIDKHLEVKVLKVTGLVERGGGGQWELLRVGDVLNRDSVIRSREGGAVLALGEKAQIDVTENSQFRVGELSSKLSRVRLEGGRIEARVHGGKNGQLAVEVMGSDTVAQASDGEFAVMRADDTQVTVASRKGAVEVAAQGKRVIVDEGQLSVVEPQLPPSIPQKIPPSLFLKIGNKLARQTRETHVVVKGETAVGAIVSVNGVVVSAKNGSFSAKIPLNEGENEIAVTATDALGRRQDEVGPKIFVDRRAPKNVGVIRWK